MTILAGGGVPVIVPSGGAPAVLPGGTVPQVVPATEVTFVGPSAYDLAVEQGYVGTLQQWLDSLHDTAALQAHVDAAEPHPAYDDLADLSLFYANRKA